MWIERVDVRVEFVVIRKWLGKPTGAAKDGVFVVEVLLRIA